MRTILIPLSEIWKDFKEQCDRYRRSTSRVTCTNFESRAFISWADDSSVDLLSAQVNGVSIQGMVFKSISSELLRNEVLIFFSNAKRSN